MLTHNIDPRIRIVRKTADEIVNNSNVVQNDNELFLPILANQIWVVKFALLCISDGAADWRFGVTGPALATGAFNTKGRIGGLFDALNGQVSGNSVGTIELEVIEVLVVNGANAGNIQLQWAQSVAHVSDTTIYEGSGLLATRLG